MTQQQSALSCARKYKKVLQDAEIPFLEVIVFGSVAKNTMHAQSDIDVAVVGTPFKNNRVQEMRAVRTLRQRVSFDLQPIWMYPEHLEDKYSTLAQEIKRDGMKI